MKKKPVTLERCYKELHHINAILRDVKLMLSSVCPKLHATDDETGRAEAIKELVADKFGLSIRQISSKRRGTEDICWPRQIAIRLCRDHTELSMDEIAKLFNRRDHASVIHSIRHVEDRMSTEPAVVAMIDELKKSITKKI
jgi:chromosomal replication initiation ATPase DnaA